MNCLITQYGKPLDESLYTIDEENKIFKTKEDYLVLDFAGSSGWSFSAGFSCTFKTGSNCTFETDYACTFKTGKDCTFNTGGNCIFSTGDTCVFKTGYGCVFDTSWGCVFDTKNDCVFDTSWGCIFNVHNNCIFKTSYDCEFNTEDNCTFSIFSNFKKIKTEGNSSVIIRDRDIGVYLEKEVEIYFDEENDEILYTKNKLTKNKYLMMKELMK